MKVTGTSKEGKNVLVNEDFSIHVPHGVVYDDTPDGESSSLLIAKLAEETYKAGIFQISDDAKVNWSLRLHSAATTEYYDNTSQNDAVKDAYAKAKSAFETFSQPSEDDDDTFTPPVIIKDTKELVTFYKRYENNVEMNLLGQTIKHKTITYALFVWPLLSYPVKTWYVTMPMATCDDETFKKEILPILKTIKAIEKNGKARLAPEDAEADNGVDFEKLLFGKESVIPFGEFVVSMPDGVLNDDTFDRENKLIFALSDGHKNESDAPRSFVVQRGSSYGETIEDLSSDETFEMLSPQFCSFGGPYYQKAMKPIIKNREYIVIPYEPVSNKTEQKYGDEYTLGFAVFGHENYYVGRIGFCANGKVAEMTNEALKWLKTIKLSGDATALEAARTDAARNKGLQLFGDHAGANGKINGLFVAGTLFGKDVFHFPNGIPFDGSNHNPIKEGTRAAFDANLLEFDNYPEIFSGGLEGAGVYATGIIDCLNFIEENEKLRCPLSQIDKSLHEYLGFEDMTGISFLNLFAWHLLTILQESDSACVVGPDIRILSGIPEGEEKIKELIHTLLKYNDADSDDFQVVLMGIRNLDVPDGDIDPSIDVINAMDSSGEDWNYDENSNTLTITGNGVIHVVPKQEDNDYPIDEKFFGILGDANDSLWGGRAGDIRKVVITGNVTEIGSEAFQFCKELQEVILPDGLEEIGNSAFWACEKLESINLPNSLLIIRASAFHACNSIKSFKIPESVVRIEKSAFAGCSSVEKYEVAKGNTIYHSSDGVLFDTQEARLLAYPSSRKGSYRVPSGIKILAEEAFSGYSGQFYIDLPDGFTTIETCAFSPSRVFCKLVISVPPSVTTIEAGALGWHSGSTVVACVENSTAHEYAKEWDLKVELIQESYFKSNLSVESLYAKSIFPLALSISGTGYLGRNERIENVRVGDKLKLKADWDSKYFLQVGVEVFNLNNETLGNLNESGNQGILEIIANAIDLITATVKSVTPLSRRRKNAKYALMEVLLEYSDSDISTERIKNNKTADVGATSATVAITGSTEASAVKQSKEDKTSGPKKVEDTIDDKIAKIKAKVKAEKPRLLAEYLEHKQSQAKQEFDKSKKKLEKLQGAEQSLISKITSITDTIANLENKATVVNSKLLGFQQEREILQKKLDGLGLFKMAEKKATREQIITLDSGILALTEERDTLNSNCTTSKGKLKHEEAELIQNKEKQAELQAKLDAGVPVVNEEEAKQKIDKVLKRYIRDYREYIEQIETSKAKNPADITDLSLRANAKDTADFLKTNNNSWKSAKDIMSNVTFVNTPQTVTAIMRLLDAERKVVNEKTHYRLKGIEPEFPTLEDLK